MTEVQYIMADKGHVQDLHALSVEFAHFSAMKSGEKHKFFPEGWKQFFVEEIEESVHDAEGFVMLAYVDGKAAGFVYAYFCPKCWYSVISDIYVDANFRNLGIGKELLKKAETWCLKYKAPLRIEVYEWNKDAIEFYKKHGYKLDCLVFEKEDRPH